MNEHQKAVQRLCMKYNVGPVKWRKMKRAWGNCCLGSGEITLNSRLFEYPVICAEHCFLHELAHAVTRQGHTKAFFTKFSLLLMENRISGIRYDKCGYYNEYKNKVAACEAR